MKIILFKPFLKEKRKGKKTAYSNKKQIPWKNISGKINTEHLKARRSLENTEFKEIKRNLGQLSMRFKFLFSQKDTRLVQISSQQQWTPEKNGEILTKYLRKKWEQNFLFTHANIQVERLKKKCFTLPQVREYFS